jgi:hypothetical protein
MLRLVVATLVLLFLSAGCGSQPAHQADGPSPPVVADRLPQSPTRLIGSIIQLFKGTDVHDQQVDRDVNGSLLEADQKLQSVLGGNAQRKILEANNKWPNPVAQVQPNSDAAMVPLSQEPPLPSEPQAGVVEKELLVPQTAPSESR